MTRTASTGSIYKHALRTAKASIYTLVIYIFQQNFEAHSNNRRFIDVLKILLEPTGHIILWLFFRSMALSKSSQTIPSGLFILLGVVLWLFTFNTLRKALTCIQQNRHLLFYNQIKPCDFIIATVTSEFIISLFTFCFTLLILVFVGSNWIVNDPLRLLCTVVLYALFVLGSAFCVACLSFFSKMASRLFLFLLRFIYLLSGIFYTAQAIPSAYRNYLLANPLFQCIEIARECFSTVIIYPIYGDLYYLAQCALGAIFLGFNLYAVMRRSILVHIMSR